MRTLINRLTSGKISSTGMFRIGIIMGLIIYSSFGYLDLYALPSTYWIAWIIRYLFILPLLIVTYFLSYTNFFIRNIKIFQVLLIGFGQVGILVMIGASQPNEIAYNTYYAGLILAMLLSSFIFRTNFKTTTYIALVTLIAYNLNVIFFQKTYLLSYDSLKWNILLNNNFFLVFTVLLTLIGAYQFEKTLLDINKINVELQKDKDQLKLAKEKLEESESNLIAILENSFDSIWSINTEYEIQYVNKVFADDFYNSFGVKLSKGVNLLQSLPEILQPIWKERYDRALNREYFIFEDKIDLGETQLYIEVAMSPILVDDKVTGASFYGKNISSIKLNEQQLIIAKNKAEESDHLKSAFLANMSHEIRTPMNSIIGFSNLLEKNNLSNENRKSFIKYIKNNGEILMNLINDIIDISKMQSSHLSIKKEEILLNNELKELINSYQATISKDKKIEFRLELPNDSEKLKIYTDKVRLRQLLNNLIDNAVKYGNSKVETGYLLDDKKCIQFYVKDDGEGIPADKFELIFESFSQLNYIPNIGGVKGVGLGLSICKLITDNLGGEIWVESEIGIGSTFFIKIPTT